MQKKAPHLVFVFHDAFHVGGLFWNDLFEDTENVVMDSHFYQAWQPATPPIEQYCTLFDVIAYAKTTKYDVWIGEWSLATDTCAHWLEGFNDTRDPFRYECELVDCPASYLPEPFNVDFDRTAESLGPYGEHTHNFIQKGKCTSDSRYFSEDDMQVYGQCALASLDKYV
jgi:glucan 1,3-beta-glucosidase